MCGINGRIGEAGVVVAAMNAATIHRGPDQSGVAVAPSFTIGMNRLAILDVTETGRQPMVSADGRYTVVYNGEIYNHDLLRRELVARGVRFVGRSDTEVIVEGFARDGQNFLSRLRGMWALAIRDNQSGTLLLSRDPFGIKPLFVYVDGATVAFSSEIKGLLALPTLNRAVNRDAVLDVLLLGYVLAPRTIFQYVRALLPGESVVFDAAGKECSRSLQHVPFSGDAATCPPSDAVLKNILQESVRQHLIADVPVGLFFSGGIDSTVLALLIQQLHTPLAAYHVAIEGRGDTAYARQIAAVLGMRMIEVPCTPQMMPAVAERFWNAMDQPFADVSFLPSLLVAERAAQDVKVVLAGEGADELFGGYSRHGRFAGALHDGFVAPSSWGMRGMRWLLRGSPACIDLLPAAQRLERQWQRRQDIASAFIAETAIGLGVITSDSAARVIGERLHAAARPDGGLAVDRLVYLPDDLLMKTDVATMAASLEARVPFVDREVFAAVAAAPLSWKRAGGQSKAPLRRLLGTALPLSLIERPKSGFSVPLSSYIFASYQKELPEVFRWYRETYSGLAPALDALLLWAEKSPTRTERLCSRLAYTVFAVLTLWQFEQRRLRV